MESRAGVPLAELHGAQGGGCLLGHEVVEHDLDEGLVGQGTGRLQVVNQQCEGQVLVGQCVAEVAVEACQGLRECRVVGEVGAQGQHIEEVAEQRRQFRPAPLGHGHTDEDVRLTAVAGQENLEDRQDGLKDSRPVAGAVRTQRAVVRTRQLAGSASAVVGLLERARIVGGQGQQIGRAGELRAPVGELLVAAFACEHLALPAGVVGVLDG